MRFLASMMIACKEPDGRANNLKRLPGDLPESPNLGISSVPQDLCLHCSLCLDTLAPNLYWTGLWVLMAQLKGQLLAAFSDPCPKWSIPLGLGLSLSYCVFSL